MEKGCGIVLRASCNTQKCINLSDKYLQAYVHQWRYFTLVVVATDGHGSARGGVFHKKTRLEAPELLWQPYSQLFEYLYAPCRQAMPSVGANHGPWHRHTGGLDGHEYHPTN